MFKNVIIIILILISPVFPSGGYDHGTSTGKGQLEIDLTWNPFDLIEFGQTYIVIGYGLSNHIDIHGYYARQTDQQDNYYYGIFYQFVDSKYLDLATAIGMRQYTVSKVKDIFFPQLLFNIKFSKNFTIGGAFVNIKRVKDNTFRNKGTAFDVAFYLPILGAEKLPKFIHELKLAIGFFNPGVFESEHGKFLPTYSIDITFKKFGSNK